MFMKSIIFMVIWVLLSIISIFILEKFGTKSGFVVAIIFYLFGFINAQFY